MHKMINLEKLPSQTLSVYIPLALPTSLQLVLLSGIPPLGIRHINDMKCLPPFFFNQYMCLMDGMKFLLPFFISLLPFFFSQYMLLMDVMKFLLPFFISVLPLVFGQSICFQDIVILLLACLDAH
uniref:Uncharacterized protein n=1 Tax=Cacopsylla melanoneura TaxID=428564 RepID=A0A8D8Q2L6_9HEMI